MPKLLSEKTKSLTFSIFFLANSFPSFLQKIRFLSVFPSFSHIALQLPNIFLTFECFFKESHKTFQNQHKFQFFLGLKMTVFVAKRFFFSLLPSFFFRVTLQQLNVFKIRLVCMRGCHKIFKGPYWLLFKKIIFIAIK